MSRLHGDCTDELPHRSGILQPQKTERILIACEDSYLENITLYVCADDLHIKIEPLDRNILKWIRWFGLFQAAFPNKPLLVAEKIPHHQMVTTRKANKFICGFACNDELDNTNLQKQQQRYGRPATIINDLFNRLQNFTQPSIHLFNVSLMEISTLISNILEVF